MTTRQDIVDCARSYQNVRWLHQGRSRAGLDCIGLVLAVAHDLGLSEFDTTDYGRIPDGERLRQELERHMQPTSTPLPGDVLLMRFEREPQHVAIVTEIGIIHAYAQLRRVTEHALQGVWPSRVLAAYRFGGLA